MFHAGHCGGADNVISKYRKQICEANGVKLAILIHLSPFPDSEFFRI